MKRALLLIVVPILLAAVVFAQTPASITPDQTNIKGCLGGSEDNYTVMQDNTGHIFKIATSGVDLKPHLGHDVTLTTHKATGVGSSVDNSVVVTELSMISEHCAEAAGGPVATVSTPSETVLPPPEVTATPAISAETAVTPVEAATAPAATTGPVAETIVTQPAAVAPAAVAAPPVETVVPPSERISVAAARPRRLPAAPAAVSTTRDVAANSSPATISTPAAATATTIATPSTASEPVATPAVDAITPAAPAKRGSLWLLIAFAVFVIVLGILVPSISRWRKRKSLERTDAPNLSFTREASSDQDKSDAQGPRKAA